MEQPSRRACSADTLVLGIETSCDETAAAVVTRTADGTGQILANVIRAQWEEQVGVAQLLVTAPIAGRP